MEDEKNAVKKRKRANQKRAERLKRNKGNTRNIDKIKWNVLKTFGFLISYSLKQRPNDRCMDPFVLGSCHQKI